MKKVILVFLCFFKTMQIFSMEFESVIKDVQQKDAVDMFEILPVEIWLKISGFLPGNSVALRSFFAPRFGISDLQAQSISKIIYKNAMMSSCDLEDFFEILNNLPIFLTAKNEKTRLKVFEHIIKLSHDLESKMNLVKELINNNKTEKFKENVTEDFSRVKFFFKKYFGGCDIDKIENMSKNDAYKSRFSSIKIKGALLKIKRKQLFYKYCKNYEMNNKSDYLFVSRLALVTLSSAVFCFINYLIYSDCPDVVKFTVFLGVLSFVLFLGNAAISSVIERCDTQHYVDMQDYINKLESLFNSINNRINDQINNQEENNQNYFSS